MKTAAAVLLLAYACPAFSSVELTPATYGAAAYRLGGPVVASNGNTFLTLWTIVNDGSGNVYGSLADASGDVLTPVSFLVVADASVQQLFSYADGYIAVVMRQGHSEIAHLSGEGKLLRYGARFPDLPPTKTPPGKGQLLSRAFNGSEFFSVYTTGSTFPPAVTLGQVMRIDGTVLRDAIAITSSWKGKVTAARHEFAVIASDVNAVFELRFASDGTPIGSRLQPPSLQPAPLYDIAIASSGAETALAWTDLRGAVFMAHVRMISPTGDAIGGTDFETDAPWDLHIFWTGTKYIIIDGGSHLRSVAPDGTVVDQPITARVTDLAIGSRTLYAAALKAYTPATYDNRNVAVIGYPLAADLKTANPVVLSMTLRRQVYPTVASDGSGLLAVWSDQRADASIISALPLKRDGTPARSEQIDLGSLVRPLDLPSGFVMFGAAFGHNVYLVVWQQDRDVVARRVDPSGNLLDVQPLLIRKSASIGDQPVAWNGTSFIIVSSSYYDNANAASLVSENGDVKSLGKFSPYAFPPIVASNGSQTLAGWPIFPPCGGIPECFVRPVGLSFVRFSPDGSLTDAVPVTISTGMTYHIATSGLEFALITEGYGSVDIRTLTAERQTIGSTDPVVVFQFPRTFSNSVSVGIAGSNVIWDGLDYVVAWRYGILDQRWIGLERFDRNLQKQASSFSDVQTVDAVDQPALAPTLPGDVLLIFSRVAEPGSVARLWTMREHEMQPMPARPPAPLITRAVGSRTSLTLDWLMAPVPVNAFFVERLNPFTNTIWASVLIDGDLRHADVDAPLDYHSTNAELYVRMRAVNAGGVSESTAPVPLTSPVRNRAVRH